MNEKVYKTMAGIGGGTLAIGIVVLVTGIVSGTMLIINGARLIKTIAILFEENALFISVQERIN